MIESAVSREDIAIQLSHLSKCYRIYDKPSHRLYQMLAAGAKKFFREFWAVKDVSFTVERGATVGIIGRNGSGKSTLLQMLSGTLEPTEGEIRTKGRIAALLELGTGFNPEFTGRENVFLSAALYGLSTDEIRSRFDDIAAFADIGDFIDQPVKTYSSGMYVRLAFAVIAHVDADILIIDEALAVGDAVFTQKCMRYLRQFRETGTLLFVSHDMAAVLSLCETTIWLDHGRIRMTGTAADVTKAYAQNCLQETYGDTAKLENLDAHVTVTAPAVEDSVSTDLSARKELGWEKSESSIEEGQFTKSHLSAGFGTGAARITKITLTDNQNSSLQVFEGGECVTLRVQAQALTDLPSPFIGFFVKDRLGQSLFGEHTYTYVQPPIPLAANEHIEASFQFRLPMLPDGEYVMTVSIADGDPWNNVQHHWLHDALVIRVASKKLRYGIVGIPFDKVEVHKL